MKANLHIHSIYSDGASTPEEIVTLAKKSGIELISLTDHSTLDGRSYGREHIRITHIKGSDYHGDGSDYTIRSLTETGKGNFKGFI